MTPENLIDIQSQLTARKALVDGYQQTVLEYATPYGVQSGSGQMKDITTHPGRYGVLSDAVKTLAAGLYSNTLRVGEQWYALQHPDAEVRKDETVNDIYSRATVVTQQMLYSSNIAEAIQPVLRYYAAVGCGCLYTYETDRGIAFKPYSPRDICVEDSPDGDPAIVSRETLLTNAQAIQYFNREGDQIPDSIITEQAEPTSRYRTHKYLHIVMENPEYIPGSRLKGHLEYIGYWICRDFADRIIRTEDLDYMPYAVPRQAVEDQYPYGYGQGTEALADAQLYNRAMDDMLDSIETAAHPPIFLPAGLSREDIDLRPRAVNTGLNPGEVPFVLSTGGDLNALSAVISETRSTIQDKCFVNFFNALRSVPAGMTATEVLERQDEKLQQILPIVSGLMSGLYRPIVRNTVIAALNAGRIPGEEVLRTPDGLDIEYSSRLVSKLKDLETAHMLEVAQITGTLEQAAATRTGAVVIDPVKWLRRIARNKGLDPDLIPAEQDIQANAELYDEAQAEASQQAAIMSSLAPADPNKAPQPGSPLDVARRGI